MSSMHDQRFILLFINAVDFLFFIRLIYISFSEIKRSYCYCIQYAAREAQTVAQAGRKYAITISTNMAGRGTDIILGGNPKVCCVGFVNILLVELIQCT